MRERERDQARNHVGSQTPLSKPKLVKQTRPTHFDRKLYRDRRHGDCRRVQKSRRVHKTIGCSGDSCQPSWRSCPSFLHPGKNRPRRPLKRIYGLDQVPDVSARHHITPTPHVLIDNVRQDEWRQVLSARAVRVPVRLRGIWNKRVDVVA